MRSHDPDGKQWPKDTLVKCKKCSRVGVIRKARVKAEHKTADVEWEFADKQDPHCYCGGAYITWANLEHLATPGSSAYGFRKYPIGSTIRYIGNINGGSSFREYVGEKFRIKSYGWYGENIPRVILSQEFDTSRSDFVVAQDNIELVSPARQDDSNTEAFPIGSIVKYVNNHPEARKFYKYRGLRFTIQSYVKNHTGPPMVILSGLSENTFVEFTVHQDTLILVKLASPSKSDCIKSWPVGSKIRYVGKVIGLRGVWTIKGHPASLEGVYLDWPCSTFPMWKDIQKIDSTKETTDIMKDKSEMGRSEAARYIETVEIPAAEDKIAEMQAGIQELKDEVARLKKYKTEKEETLAQLELMHGSKEKAEAAYQLNKKGEDY